MKRLNKPKIGDKIYIHSSFHISRGSDDYVGGLATISKIYDGISAGDKTWFIDIEEVPGVGLNYEMLMEGNTQKELKKQFGRKKAHPSPDIDTPWIEDGDWVNGKVYHGKPIW